MRLRPIDIAAAVALFSCASLDAVPSGTCGNGVVDADEDCDSFPSNCGTPSSGTGECRLRCHADPKVLADPKDTSVAACPEGWSCSVDGFCREPTGAFEASSEPVSAGVATMVVGDFDGDGRADILGSGARAGGNAAKVRVHYFGDNAILSHVTPFLAPFTPPSVYDFDGDGVSDFVFGAQGIGIMVGQTDRSFASVIFPSFKQEATITPVLVRGTSLPLPGGAAAAYLIMSTGFLGSVGGGPVGPAHYAVSVPGGPDKLLGQPAWGRVFDAVPDSTCGEVVLAFDTPPTTTIVVASPCTGSQLQDGSPRWWPDHKLQQLTLSERADGGILLADYDGDSHLDIIVGAASGVIIFPSDKGTGFGAPYSATKSPLRGAKLDEMPLAAADVNGDGAVDYIISRGIEISKVTAQDAGSPRGVPDYAYIPGGVSRWSKAMVTRLNGDAYPDIVAASADQADLDFLAGTGGGELTPYTISTSGPVTEMAAGDFDGDLVPDLAFVEASSATGKTEVVIAYGRTSGPPETPRAVGSLSGISRIDALPRSLSALEDLAIFAQTEGVVPGGPRTSALAVLLGSGDRQPIAPLIFSDANSPRPQTPNITREWQPQAVIAGNFLDQNRVDLAGFALAFRFKADDSQPQPPPYPASLWVADGTTTSPTEFAPAKELLNLDALATKYGRSESVVLLTAVGDIDRDGLADAVALAQTKAGSIDGPAFHVLIRGAISSTAVAAEQVVAENQIGLLDVDADGFLDVVLAVDAGEKSKVLVFLNDGHGAFVREAIAVGVPNGAEPARGFAQVTTRGARGGAGRHADLVVVTTHHAYLASFVPDSMAFALRDLGVALGDGTGVAAGDFDGDGVADIALADRGAIRIVRQKPRLP